MRFILECSMLRRTALAGATTLFVGATPLLDGLGPTAVAAQDAFVSGRLSVVWEDPLPGWGTPRLRHFLATEDGRMIPLRVTEAELRFVGGPLDAHGEFVEVSGRWTGRGTGPGAFADRELDVSSVRPGGAPPGAAMALTAAAAPIVGSYPWVTVLCRFSDAPTVEPQALSWYEGLLQNTYPGMDHYWRELSFDNANVVGSVAYGWYDLPEPQSAYVSGSSANLGKLKNDCAAAADADVFFPDFVGINFQFNLNIGGFSWGGGSNLVVDGQSRFYRMTWLADWADTFVYAHEMGHGFGLPHSSGPYGAVYDSRWDVMSGARNDHDPLWGWLAPHTISYHKDLLGWIPPDRLYVATQGSSETITLHRLADIGAGGDYLMARIPRGDGTYYTVEARRYLGYDVHLRGEALVMHHVTSRAFVVDPDNDDDPNDDGAMWLPGESFEDLAAGITVTVDASTPEGHVVTISVSEPGHIALDPTSLGFAAQQTTDPPPQSFVIGNTGIGALDWTATVDRTWLSVGTTSGETMPGGSTDVTVFVAAADLSPGDYSGSVTISGNADNTPQSLAVNLSVSAAPLIVIETGDLDLATVVGQNPPPQDLVIGNTGSATLEWSATSDVGWAILPTDTGTLESGAQETASIVISTDGLSSGTYTGTVTVSGNAPNSPQTLAMTLTVADPPSMALDPVSVDFAVWVGDDPESVSVTITNDGEGVLSWSATEGAGWLTLSSAAGELSAGTSESLVLDVSSSTLDPGTYTESVTFDGNADDAPQEVAVSLTVSAVPLIVIETADMELETVVGQGPPPQDLVIGNSGTATLEWSATSDAGWATLPTDTGTAEPGGQEVVSVVITTDGLSTGTYSGTVTVSGNAPNSPQTLAITLTIGDPASMALSPASIDFAVWVGDDPESASVTITNDGEGVLSWSATEDVGWLSLSGAAGELTAGSSESLVLEVSSSTLDPGTYTESVTFDGNADDTPQEVPVELIVKTRPDLAVQVRAWLQREGLMSRVSPAAGEETP
jgi:hypothetical protein